MASPWGATVLVVGSAAASSSFFSSSAEAGSLGGVFCFLATSSAASLASSAFSGDLRLPAVGESLFSA